MAISTQLHGAAGHGAIGHGVAGSDPVGHDAVGGAAGPPVLDLPAEPPASPTSLAQIAKRIWNAADPVASDANPAAEPRPGRPDSSTTFPVVRYGYERSEVQAYVDWFENYLRDPAAAGHVPLARFHVVEVGYELGAVDAYCDRVTRVLRGLGPIDGDVL